MKLFLPVVLFLLYFNQELKALSENCDLECPQGTYTLSIQIVNPILCNGGQALLRANVVVTSGTVTGIQYSWSGGGNTKDVNKPSGSYTVTVTSTNSASQTATIVVSQPSLIGVSGILPSHSCFTDNNGQINIFDLNGGTSPYTIQLLDPANNQLINQTNHPGDITVKIFPLSPRTYKIKIIDANGCIYNHSSLVAILKTTKRLEDANPNIIIKNISCIGNSDGQITSTPEQILSGALYNFVLRNSAGRALSGISKVTTATFNNLPPATYIITISLVFNNVMVNCDALEINVTVGQPTQLINTGNVQDATCFGSATGSIINNTSGGNGGYKYTWSNGSTTKDITNLVAKTYTLTVTDKNNCSPQVQSFVVKEPSQLVGTSTITSVDCFDNSTGKINIVPTGGNGGYKYLWSNGSTSQNITGLKAGEYKLTLTDMKDCNTNPSPLVFNVTQPDKIENTSFTTKDLVCFNQPKGEITQNIKGGIIPYQYLWNDSKVTADRNTLFKGTYSCSITDKNLCKSTFTYTINEPSQLIHTLDSILPTASKNRGAIFTSQTGGTFPYFYDWRGPNAFTAKTQDITNLTEGEYTLNYQDDNGCGAEIKYLVPIFTGVNDSKLKNLVIYQNKNQIIIRNLQHQKEYIYAIYNAEGKTIIQSKFTSLNGDYEIENPLLSSGIYYLKLICDAGYYSTAMMIE